MPGKVNENTEKDNGDEESENSNPGAGGGAAVRKWSTHRSVPATTQCDETQLLTEPKYFELAVYLNQEMILSESEGVCFCLIEN